MNYYRNTIKIEKQTQLRYQQLPLPSYAESVNWLVICILSCVPGVLNRPSGGRGV